MNWTNRIRAAFDSASNIPDNDVIEELAQHAQAMYEAARADGCSHQDADRRVADQVTRWKADVGALRHRSRRPSTIEPPPAVSSSRFSGLAQDLRYSTRLLRRQARHALLTILTMALGVGATTTLFSVAYGVLMKPLPWPHGDRIVELKEMRGGNTPRFGAFTNAAYLAWREQPTTIEHIAAWSQRVVTLTGAGEPERIRITAATASLFAVLGVRPLLGSFFDQKEEASPVIVLSEGLWRQRFGGDPAVLGRLVHLDGQAYTVVGVLADTDGYPDRQTRAVVPYSIRPTTGNYLAMFNVVAALGPGVTPAQAAAEGTARGRLAADTGMTTLAIFGNNGPIEVTAQPLRDALTADVRRPLIMLLVAVGLLLVTATANVASLQLARATTRSREMAIRAALGAGRARVTRQLLVENLLVGIAGCAAGLAMTWGFHRSLPSLLPADFPRVNELAIDAVVVTFALLVSSGTSIFVGLLPALRVHRVNLVEALADEGTALPGAGMRTRTTRARIFIMAAQVAIACVLLVGASLLGRSFAAMMDADRGYEPSGLLTARLSLPATVYPPERRFAVLSQILERLAVAPAVTDVAFTSESPLTPGGSTAAFKLTSDRGDVVPVQASTRLASARVFSALRMRVVSGRGFSDTDTETSQPVAVVNSAFARRYLENSPIGAKLPMGVGYQSEGAESVIVGIVDDVRYLTANDTSLPEIYYCYRQLQGKLPVQVVTLLLRTSGDPASLGPMLRTVVREVDSALVAEGIMTMEDRMSRTLARPRLYAILLGSFAAFALLVAAVGLFGVLSYSVSQRLRELAVRVALGARGADILRLVLRQGLVITVAGLLVGMFASAWLTRLLSTQLYGVTTYDPLTFVVVPLVLLIVGTVACFVPARRAACLDPLRVLRGG
jgi:putative ABC transport system permease protein